LKDPVFLFKDFSRNKVNDWPCFARSKLFGMFVAGSTDFSIAKETRCLV